MICRILFVVLLLIIVIPPAIQACLRPIIANPTAATRIEPLMTVLHKIADVKQRHSVVKAGHNERAEACSEYRAAAAYQ